MATSMWTSLASVLTETFGALRKTFFDGYRPELHYMRGPGPRWREKHELRLAPVPVRVRAAPVAHLRSRLP